MKLEMVPIHRYEPILAFLSWMCLADLCETDFLLFSKDAILTKANIFVLQIR